MITFLHQDHGSNLMTLSGRSAKHRQGQKQQDMQDMQDMQDFAKSITVVLQGQRDKNDEESDAYPDMNMYKE
jgi:hypothetical protein